MHIVNNDQQLAARLRDSDHNAFEELYAAYHQLLYSTACKYLKSATAAEDAVHEVFVKVWLHREELDPSQGVRNFLFKCLKFHVLNLIRDHKRSLSKQYELIYNASSEHRDAESTVIFNDYRKVVDHAINNLSAQKKKIFRLRSYEGLSNEEVARQLGLSINTVKFQYAQASKALKHALKIMMSALLSLAFLFVIFS
ncbi:RNA polymerase sigma factor [Chitinophaga sp. CF418]|uniref:RNA polymerase sigma factor n=1 Tax=Chitinophaga sp. CF418 TaxID=1855287 RepID=UPI0009226D64|nr:RNA polymerase sigma-70 factor [Chitinophaga sp. CF418]SHM82781.1 RNA polymerase sigma-70 factor, ECF subfamily [Chitinophaga sp. CF418]